MGLFEIGKVGLPFAIAGVVTMVVLAPLLLPERRAPSEAADADAREFTVEMVVDRRARDRRAQRRRGRAAQPPGRVYLVEVERDGHRISSVRPDEILAEGDRLTFAGNVTRILDLQQMRGLASAEERHFAAVGSAIDRRLYEAVVAPGVGARRASTLKQAGFRGRYGGAVIAIHRAGERVAGKLGEVAPAARATCSSCSPDRPSARAPSTGATSSWSPPSTARARRARRRRRSSA